jgi:CP family cyanate transporter-like MFS transporter
MHRFDPALLVVLGGVSAALHVGKLPPALPVLQQALGVSLLQAGFLLSLVQLAGMTLGLAVGLAADSLGLKRTMVAGLAILSAAGLCGGWARDPHSLMALRAAEGLGFLLASMPAPALIRRLVSAERMSRTLGLWSAYMPFGTALALLAGPLVIALAGWPGWWWLLAALSALMALWLALALPPDAAAGAAAADRQGWSQRLRLALSSPGPWLVALSFAVYSSQWLAVIGFLPSVYAEAGLAPSLAGAATALAAAANITGNIAAGRLLQRGVRPERLLYTGFAAMALGGVLAFAPVLDGVGRYVAVLVFSSVGGLIPGTLFSLAVRLAPGERTVSATMGLAQQWSAAGQLAGPPLVAWVATRAGGWQWSGLVTGGCAFCGLVLAALLGALLRRQAAHR